ncbi:hypothetical protein D3C81_1782380 [compost metagenome]
MGGAARLSHAVCRKSGAIEVLCLFGTLLRRMDLFFDLQCYGAAFCGNVNSVGTVHMQTTMENIGNLNRCTAALALAPSKRDAAAAWPYPVIYPEAVAASNEANLGTSSKVDLSVFVPALSFHLDYEIY